MAIYDPCAAVALVDENAISFQPARIDVELAGSLTRGRTVVETRARHTSFNARYAVEVDAGRARRCLIEALSKEAAK